MKCESERASATNNTQYREKLYILIIIYNSSTHRVTHKKFFFLNNNKYTVVSNGDANESRGDLIMSEQSI